jgi:integrase-like protein
MGIRDKPIAPGSPWQNGFAERLIGSIRRERVDHIVVLGEMHLRRVLKSYARYYNETRTHRSLDKDAPISRPVQRVGIIMSHALLGGLHHLSLPKTRSCLSLIVAVRSRGRPRHLPRGRISLLPWRK